MVNLQVLFEARQYGEIRISVVSEITRDLSRVLSKFGLTADSTMLVEYDRATALSILTELLWKDMARESACLMNKLRNFPISSLMKIVILKAGIFLTGIGLYVKAGIY